MLKKQARLCLGLILLVFYFARSTGQPDLCTGMDTQGSCDSCITAHPDCVWCTFNPGQNVTAVMTTIHCYNRTTYNSTACNDEIEDPDSVVMNIRDEELFNPIDPGRGGEQVRPQEVRMKLRRGSPQSFDMSFIALRNTPLDVYFLLDVSGSLVSTFNAIRDNLEAIAMSIGNISSAFRIGIGGFIDKDVFPYAGSTDYRVDFGSMGLICRQARNVCDLAFGYRHYLNLTDNITAFQNVLSSTIRLAVNVDVPEGGLDALLQATVCRDIIGWRDDALKMLFFITDSDYHIAGDGYLAGIVRPNDGMCHMEEIPDSPGTFEYTFSVLQDYPSIRQVLSALERELIVPIFAIQQAAGSVTLDTYTNLAMEFQRVQSQAIAIATEGSGDSLLVTADTIISLIEDAYNDTSQTVQVQIPNIDGYDITIEPINCPRPFGSGCRVLFDETVMFRVTLELTDCDLANATRIELQGAPYSFSVIQVEEVCKCDCSAPEFHERSSPACSGNGTLVCGACQCNEGFFGDFCQCDSPINPCVVSFEEECGGEERGICSTCGECMCIPPYFDAEQGCRCNLEQCENDCSGNGQCVCREEAMCECTAIAPLSGELFIGRDCSCNPDVCFNANWTSSTGGPAMLCQVVGDESSAGMCTTDCQGCNCDFGVTGIRDLISRGGLCLPRGTDALCNFFVECVGCELRGETCPQTEACASHPNYRLQGTNEMINFEDYQAACSAIVDGCTYDFYIGRNNPFTRAVIIDEASQECPPPISIAVAVGIAVGLVIAIVIIGLIILCLLKIAFVVWDKHEYGKFTQELQNADFAPHENPLYLTPQQDYVNPILRRHSSKRKQ